MTDSLCISERTMEKGIGLFEAISSEVLDTGILLFKPSLNT